MHKIKFNYLCGLFLVFVLTLGIVPLAAGQTLPSLADLAEKVKPAVVNISTTSTMKIPGNVFKNFFGGDENDEFSDFFKQFYERMPDQELKQQSLGSGFIFSKDGYIITNSHVVDDADKIMVKLSDGREFKAKVVGKDTKTDLTLIKIASPFENLPILSLGDSEKMRVGDWVIAVGNPFGLEQTITQGIISAKGRVIGSGPYDDFLQTDAPINPGNSGGPLINMKGEVIGVNSAILPAGQGIGFAIPSSMAQSIITQLKEKGKVVRGWIGVAIQAVTPPLAKSFGMSEPKGALVSDVAPDSPAEKGGIKRGDILVTFDGKPIKNINTLPRMVADTPIGKEAPIDLIRNGKKVSVKVKIAELTDAKLTSQSQGPMESLGMNIENITPQLQRKFGFSDKSGVVVVSVKPGSISDEAGIKAGDVIKEVNRKTVNTTSDYNEAISKMEKGQPVLVLMKRGKQTIYVSMETREQTEKEENPM